MSDKPTQQTASAAMVDEFDIGPLSWVKSEITFALAHADEGVSQLESKADHPNLIRQVVAHLHQVTGALRMVGLEPVTLVSGAIEKLVEAMGRGDVPMKRETIGTARSAIKAVNRYLEGLMRGERNRPLVLYPEYRSVLAALGSERASAVDLFFPRFSKSPRFIDSEATQRGPDLTRQLTLKRMEFQKELLQVLRKPDCQQHLAAMAEIVAAIEAIQPASSRLFWWIASGFLQGLAKTSTPLGGFQKQLCGRIDVEMKHQIDGTAAVSERLLREYLFAVAHQSASTNRLREIHDVYQLRNLLPPASQEDPGSTRVKILLSDIKTQLMTVQETWNQVSGGDQQYLAQFAAETAQLNNFGRSVTNKSLRAIFTKLAEVGNDLMTNPRIPADNLAMEIATMLLAAKDGLDNWEELGSNFDSMTQTRVMRLTAALKNRPLPSGTVHLVDVRRTAQERKLFQKLGQESIAALNRIEELLDAFFRDPADRGELARLPDIIKQLEGVLVILESKAAATLLKAGQQLVQKFVTATGPAAQADAELAAEIFNHLALFVSAVQQGYDNPDELLEPLLARLTSPQAKTTA